MKTTFKLLGFLLCLFAFLPVTMASAESTNAKFVVTANYAHIYETPDFSAASLKKVNLKTVVEIQHENEKPKEYQNGDYVFYKVLQYDSIDGFIYAELLTPQNDIITSIPNFNGQTNADCKVFSFNNNQMIESQLSLKKGERIFLYEGFDKKKEYTAVVFISENQVVYGHIKTEHIKPDGINPLLISCVVAIIAVLGIIFTWMFMKNKKVRILKPNKK